MRAEEQGSLSDRRTTCLEFPIFIGKLQGGLAIWWTLLRSFDEAAGLGRRRADIVLCFNAA